MTSSAKFLHAFIAPALVILVLALPNLVFLYNAGELYSAERLTGQLISGPKCLIGLAAPRFKAIDYKIKLYKHARPDVVVLGSSRSMQFRARYFNASFMNMGGAVGGSLRGVERATAEILATHKPKLAIVTIDFWWFQEGNVRRNVMGDKYVTLPQKWTGIVQSIFLPLFWMSEGKLSIEDYLRLIFRGPNCRMGMLAEFRSQGFMRDGSYFYGSMYTEQTNEGFSDAITKINTSSGQYVHGAYAQQDMIEKFFRIIKTWQQAGVDVFVILPPLAPSITKYMKRMKPDSYRFIDEVRRSFSGKLKQSYDFHDPKSLDTLDCEFLDGHHAGEIVSVRMLKRLENTSAEQYLNMPAIKYALVNNRGRTISPDILAAFLPGMSEVDFLGIGCDRAGGSQKVIHR